MSDETALTWYALEVSRSGDDDWYANGDRTYDTLDAARRARAEAQNAAVPGWDFRIVKKTETVEIIETTTEEVVE